MQFLDVHGNPITLKCANYFGFNNGELLIGMFFRAQGYGAAHLGLVHAQTISIWADKLWLKLFQIACCFRYILMPPFARLLMIIQPNDLTMHAFCFVGLRAAPGQAAALLPACLPVYAPHIYTYARLVYQK